MKEAGLLPLRPRQPRLDLGPKQVVATVLVLGPGQLGVDEAVESLVGDDVAARIPEPSVRPPAGGTSLGQDETRTCSLQQGVPVQTGAPPTAGGGLRPAAGRRRAGNPGSWSRFASTP